jgi:hypothetical protein
MAIGRKTGGRKKGSLNKRTRELQRLAAEVPDKDSPLAFMLSVLQDPDLPLDLRLDAAKNAAPYLHPKLAAVTLKGEEDQPVRHVFEWAGPVIDATDDEQE